MPEKELHAIPRPLRDQYEKGLAAIQRDNLDYAITILDAVLRQEPAFYKCREALRAAQFKRAGQKRGFLKRMLGTAGRSPLLAKGQLALRANPLEALVTAEQILNSDPHSLPAHRLLAEAALASDLPRTAVLSLEIVFRNAPDRSSAMKLAHALAQTGQIARGESILSDLAKAFPADMAVQQALKDVSARRTLTEDYRAIQDGAGSYRDILRDPGQATGLEQDQQQIPSQDDTARRLHDYESQLAADPANPRLLRAIAELLAQRKEFEMALARYQQVADLQSPPEPWLERAITEVTLRRYEHQMQQLDPAVPESSAERTRLETEKREYALNRARLLTERYPNDLQFRFELGVSCFEAGRLNEAIQEFQKAQNNPNRRLQALAYLGRCFARRGLSDLAIRALQTALREKQGFDEEKKELLYELGQALEAFGQSDQAIEQYKLIYEADIGYRDVAAKIDAHYAANKSGPP